MDITEILNEINISYTDHGSYVKFKCINPSHEDNNPSMTMLKETGYARCWSCGLSLSLSKFVEYVSGKNLKDFGYDVYDYKKSNVSLSIPKKRKLKYRIEKGNLEPIYNNPEALLYVYSLKINDNMIHNFNIQYCKYAEIGFKEGDSLTKIYDRICIPIYFQNELINMECRTYKKTNYKKVIYPKGSRSDVLFNYDNIDFSKPVIVVEGLKSALRIYNQYTTNVVSTFGSALGNYQKELLKTIPNIWLFPDNDDAGMSMIDQFENFYAKEYNIIMMPKKGQDPADGNKRHLMKAINNRIESNIYFSNLFKNELNIDTQKKVVWL